MKRSRRALATWSVVAAAVVAAALIHTLPVPFVLDAIAGDRSVWHMPSTSPPTIYLTYDDGPNPTTTPDLLDALAREGVRATFFLIDEHVSEDTAPLIRRMFTDGHAVALHSGKRWDLLRSSTNVSQLLTAHAERVQMLAGARPCRAFRPHGGRRSYSMYNGLREIDYRLIGWGWMLWDVAPRARLRVRHGVLGFTTIVTDDPHAVCSGDSALQLAGCGGSSHPALHATRSDVSVRRAPSWSVG